jgi:hypothetical protein
VPCQRFQNVDRCTFVGQVGQKRPPPTVADGPFQARALLDQCKGLRQAIGVVTCPLPAVPK